MKHGTIFLIIARVKIKNGTLIKISISLVFLSVFSTF